MGRSSRIVACASTLLLFGAGCRALLDLPDDGAAADTRVDAGETGAVDATDPVLVAALSRDAAPACKHYRPAEGDYAYAALTDGARGKEGVYFLKDDGKAEDKLLQPAQFIPPTGSPTFNGRITYSSNDAFIFHADLNLDHYTEFTFISSPTTGLQVMNVTERLFGIDVHAKCDPPVDLLRCVMTPDAEWAGAALGSFDFFGTTSTFGAKVRFRYVDDGLDSSIAVGSKLVDTFHVFEERSFTDRIGGAQKNEYWFSKDNGLLIQAKLVSGDIGSGKVDGITMTPTPNLALEYTGHAEFVLKSLTPTPLPPADAGPDATK